MIGRPRKEFDWIAVMFAAGGEIGLFSLPPGVTKGHMFGNVRVALKGRGASCSGIKDSLDELTERVFVMKGVLSHGSQELLRCAFS